MRKTFMYYLLLYCSLQLETSSGQPQLDEKSGSLNRSIGYSIGNTSMRNFGGTNTATSKNEISRFKQVNLIYQQRSRETGKGFFVELSIDFNNSSKGLILDNSMPIHDTVHNYSTTFLLFFNSTDKPPKSENYKNDKFYINNNYSILLGWQKDFASTKNHLLRYKLGAKVSRIQYTHSKYRFAGSISKVNDDGSFINIFFPWWILNDNSSTYFINGYVYNTLENKSNVCLNLINGLSYLYQFNKLPIDLEFGIEMDWNIARPAEFKSKFQRIASFPYLGFHYRL